MTWASLFSDVPHWKNSMGRLTPVWLRPRLTLQSHSTRARLTVLASDTKGHRPDSFIRVHLARANAIGPGKADLLEVIADTGSIAEAARRIGMSYRRAWSLVRALNKAFTHPLVETRKGGPEGGSATLTATGREVLRLYRALEAGATQAIAGDIAAFRKLLATPS